MDARRVHAALNEYDERLIFDRNLATGTWAAFVKMPHGETPQPVIDFGLEVPSVDQALARVRAADSLVQGERMLVDINQHNDKIREPGRANWDRIIGELAEVAESAAHREGLTNYHRSLPKRDPKQRSTK